VGASVLASEVRAAARSGIAGMEGSDSRLMMITGCNR
jgi:hypothetical protein